MSTKIFDKKDLRSAYSLASKVESFGFHARITKKGHVVVANDTGNVTTLPCLHKGNDPNNAERLFKRFLNACHNIGSEFAQPAHDGMDLHAA